MYLGAMCLGPACSEGAGEGPPGFVAMDDQSLLSTALRYRDSAAFVQVNDTPYASALGGEAIINLYISAHAFTAYAAIDPETSDTGVILPDGAIIVREVTDAAGNVTKLTLMAKGPAGYNPDLGDYWFAVTEADGTPVVENGATRVGRLEDCYSCHIPRAGDDFLFGVPADNRRGFGEPSPAPAPGNGGDEPQPPPGPICGDFVCERGESCLTCEYDCGECDDDDDDDDDDDRHDDDDDHDDDDGRGRGRGRGRGGR